MSWRITALAALSLFVPKAYASADTWPLWESYAKGFLDHQGRIVDYDRASSTTSEGQAYALFFSLVANDRLRFNKILRWTEANLTAGGLRSHLPAWHWGQAEDGRWRALDSNSASDADLWLAYTLLEAGRLWRNAGYTEMGTALARQIEGSETAEIEDLGTMLLPAPHGFHPLPDLYQLNPSYLPLQVLDGLATETQSGPWARIAGRVPKLLAGSSVKGVVLDWIGYRVGYGFEPAPPPNSGALASYDAIRVYLWAGMLAPGHPQGEQMLGPMQGMVRLLRLNPYPPAEITAQGTVKTSPGSAGFSAAVIPFLLAVGEPSLAKENTKRVDSELDSKTGLYGKPARYYDQNLALFAMGWLENRYEFDLRGRLVVNWSR